MNFGHFSNQMHLKRNVNQKMRLELMTKEAIHFVGCVLLATYCLMALFNIGLLIGHEKRTNGVVCQYFDAMFTSNPVYIQNSELGYGISGCPLYFAIDN